jgi:phage/plasmid-like protein (TIGR03299 family)
MPAEIAVINGIAAVAYQGEMPWHKLGTQMEGTPDVQAALKAANLDWEVQLRSMFYRHGDKTVKVPSRRAVVRDVDGQLLSTVGSDYTPMQNSEAFAVLQPACEQFGVTIETAGALGKGDRVWMLAKMPMSIEPVPGDKVDGHLLILTGHNGWTSYSARLTPTRVVCANTLQLALNDKAFVKLRHVASAAEQLDQVAGLVTNMVATLKTTGESFSKLAARKMTMDEMTSYVNEVLNIDALEAVNPIVERRRATILELATTTGKGIEFAPFTAWTAFNAITEYVDHVRPAEAKNLKSMKDANQSALFGTNSKLKAKALVLARRLIAA